VNKIKRKSIKVIKKKKRSKTIQGLKIVIIDEAKNSRIPLSNSLLHIRIL
jgi:hypothetical protein